mmetsp:Transcript_69517/g.180763  ORF Transcript_69517/g.180763 Transcript_69517/m.180763 type:complete len:125 (-) Transcript_69517:219-593(-)
MKKHKKTESKTRKIVSGSASNWVAMKCVCAPIEIALPNTMAVENTSKAEVRTTSRAIACAFDLDDGIVAGSRCCIDIGARSMATSKQSGFFVCLLLEALARSFEPSGSSGLASSIGAPGGVASG